RPQADTRQSAASAMAGSRPALPAFVGGMSVLRVETMRKHLRWHVASTTGNAPMTPFLLALLLSANPQSQAAPAPTEYADAKRLADADEASVTGPARETLLAAQAALLDAGVAECNRFDLRGDVTP